MNKLSKLPDLSRTEAAIAAYDKFDATYENRTCFDFVEWFNKIDELGRAVGHAFGLDTADRNNLRDCEMTIRPGHKVPGPGCELSFVRKAVKQWREQQK